MEWRSLWQRRAVTWSMAASIAAVLAAGGLWLYQESRVDDALVVVANTTPEPHAMPAAAAPVLPSPAQGAAVRPVEQPGVAPQSAILAPAPAPEAVAASEPLATPQESTPAPAESPATAPVEAALPTVLAPAAVVAAGTAVVAKKTRTSRKPAPRASRRKSARPTPAAPAAPVRRASAEVTAKDTGRQRREETLMQCRAHGYDQRQCDRRECEMTRFGFACKG